MSSTTLFARVLSRSRASAQTVACELCSLDLRQGGLGLKKLIAHAPAAFLAPASSCRTLCQQLDNDIHWHLASDGTASNRALTLVSPDGAVTAETSDALREQVQSKEIGVRTVARLADLSPASVA